jgi:uncharacterized OB-fold protein
MPPVAGPVTDDDNRFFWDGIRQGRLLLQRCASCATVRHPPGPMCLSHHPTEPDAEPRIVVLVDLEEGVRLVANLQGLPWSEVMNDLHVEVFFDEVDGVRLPQFRPAQ